VQEDQGGAGVHPGTVQPGGYRFPVGEPVRLDLGCGTKREDGWTRIDYPVERALRGREAAETAPDIPCDLRAIPLPDECADEARAIHVIEHFQPWEALDVLKEWVRLLKPGGSLALECPSLDKIMALFNVPGIPPQYTYWGLFGDPRYNDPLMMHHWCYSQAQLARLLGQAGLVDIRAEPARFHIPVRDQRLVGIKPEAERRIILTDETPNEYHDENRPRHPGY
jgi:SAM-dependent methyltransferase